MICHNCEKNFNYNDELKFCPFCGCEINVEKKVNLGNTLDMPRITDKQIINRRNKKKFKKVYEKIKTVVFSPKIAATMVAVLAIVFLSVLAYRYFLYGAVDTEQLKKDLNNRRIALSGNHSFVIKENYIKDMKVIDSKKGRNNKEKNILLELQLNNDKLDIRGKINLHYIYEAKDRWTLAKNIKFMNYSVFPAVGMNESQLLEQLGKKKIDINNGDISLQSKYLKTVHLESNKLELKDKKENLTAKVVLDSGIQNAEGKLRLEAVFNNYKWHIASVKQTSEFKTTLSDNFSYAAIIRDIHTMSIEGNYVYNTVFGKEPFYVSNKFLQNVKIKNKTYDAENEQLHISAERSAVIGELKINFIQNCTYQLAFDAITRVDADAKPAIASVRVDKVDENKFQQLIVDAELEGKKKFFFWEDTHVITEDEAGTFKVDKVAYIKGSLDEQYVTGKITLDEDGEQKEEKAAAKVYLKYDAAEGYVWYLDKIVTKESPDYDTFQ